MALANVTLQYQYFADPARGRPIALGFVFVGIVDTDPETPINQLEIFAKQEDGTEVSISQPVSLSAGGVPQLNGSPIRILVDGAHSLKVLDSGMGQVYYLNDSIEGVAITPFGESLITATDADAGRVIMNSMEKVSSATTNNLMIFDPDDEATDSGVQLQREANAGGGADALTATFTPALPSPLIDKVQVKVRASLANATTTPTFNGDTIVKNGNEALAVGDIFGPGHMLIMDYNLANTNWELINPAGTVSVFTVEFESTAQTITSSGLLTLAHGLSAVPKVIQFYGIATSADAGYSIGDRVFFVNSSNNLSDKQSAVYFDATNVFVRFSNSAQCFSVGNKATGSVNALTNGNWDFYVRAYA